MKLKINRKFLWRGISLLVSVTLFFLVYWIWFSKPSQLAIGIMSGTSMDGVDTVIVETNGYYTIKEHGQHSLKYPLAFHWMLKTSEFLAQKQRGNITTVFDADLYPEFLQMGREKMKWPQESIDNLVKEIQDYCQKEKIPRFTLREVVRHFTDYHIGAVSEILKKTNLPAEKIQVIGFHGQTLFHNPKAGLTLQIGDGQRLADRTKIKVVNNFREKDVFWGGQGAPLAPLYHQALAVRDNLIPCVVVNCGGIANLTAVLGKKLTDVIGFDSGPGNALVDLFVKQKTMGKCTMDKNGQFGTHGEVRVDMTKELSDKSITSHNDRSYYTVVPPKSLCLSDIHLPAALSKLSIEDGCATLEDFTGLTIANAVCWFDKIPKTWILAGGGWYNPVIKERLICHLKKCVGVDVHVVHAQEINWPNDTMEAGIFAYLAVRRLLSLPTSVPSTTRVKKPISSGTIYQPAIH